MAWITRITYHMDHLGAHREEADIETFAGVRISKGATRAEGLDALRRMVSGPGDASDEEPESATDE